MEQDNKIKNKVVQTYADDMVGVIESDKSGLLKKIIHEEEKHEKEKKKLSPGSKKNKFFMFSSFLLIILGLAILFYFFLMMKIPTVETEEQFTPLVFIDQSTFLEVKDLNKDKIVQTILNEINSTEVKDGGVEGIYLSYDKRLVGLREFIALIEGNFFPGDNLLFIEDRFLMGVVNNETNDFFILLKVRSMADVFGSLRSWESKMFLDLQRFFGFSKAPETEYLLTKSFEDVVVGNKNARVLYDNDDKIVMMYIFANDNSIIITNTEDAGGEIMLRLTSSQIKK